MKANLKTFSQLCLSSGFLTAAVLVNFIANPSVSFAAGSDAYDVMSWKRIADVQVQNGNEVQISGISDFEGQFIRIVAPASCGFVSLGLTAEGSPVTPRLVYDNGATVVTPAMRRWHWYVAQRQNIKFSQLWLRANEIENGTCVFGVEVSKANVVNPIPPGTVSVRVSALAHTTISAKIAKEIAENKTVAKAQAECQSLNVARVPETARCVGNFASNRWNARCQASFYCFLKD